MIALIVRIELLCLLLLWQRKSGKYLVRIFTKSWTFLIWTSSLHHLIFNSFHLVLVLWSLLRQIELSICVVVLAPPIEFELFVYNGTFFRRTMTSQIESLDVVNSLHNTKMRQKGLKIISWRLLDNFVKEPYIQDWLKHWFNLCKYIHLIIQKSFFIMWFPLVRRYLFR